MPLIDKSPQKYENALLAVLTATFGVVFLDRAALNFLAPFVAKDLGLNNTQIGMLASGLAITWAISGIGIGRLCDRIGNQRLVLTVCIIVFSLCSVLSGIAGSFGTLLLSRLLMGLAEGPALPVAQTLLAQASSPARRGINMGLMQQFGSNVLGAFIAPMILLYIASHFGWRNAFFLAGLPGLACAALVWRTVRNPPPGPTAAATGAFPISSALRYRNIVICMAIAGLSLAWVSLCFVFLPLYFIKVAGFAPTTMGVLMSLLGASAVVASIVVPALSDRLGRKPAVLIVFALSMALPLGVGFSGTSVVLIGLSVFVGFLATGAASLVMATIPTETLPSPNVAAVVGLIVGTGEIFGAFAGPILGGLVADRYGLASTLWLQGGFVVAIFGLGCLLVETAPVKAPAPGAAGSVNFHRRTACPDVRRSAWSTCGRSMDGQDPAAILVEALRARGRDEIGVGPHEGLQFGVPQHRVEDHRHAVFEPERLGGVVPGLLQRHAAEVAQRQRRHLVAALRNEGLDRRGHLGEVGAGNHHGLGEGLGLDDRRKRVMGQSVVGHAGERARQLGVVAFVAGRNLEIVAGVGNDGSAVH